jgi:hypothetical protein
MKDNMMTAMTIIKNTKLLKKMKKSRNKTEKNMKRQISILTLSG